MCLEIFIKLKRKIVVTWRNILITNPAKLRCENKALIIEQDCNYKIPLEDIGSIIIDCPKVILTVPLLSMCAEYGIAIYISNSRHIPNGIFLSFGSHNKILNLLKLQLNLAKPVIKNLWTQIVKAKIKNQASCLKACGLIDEYNYLYKIASKVRSGDPDNIEARSAAFYFKNLFSKKFSRKDDESMINSSLNYGYAIFRGEISRKLIAHGLQTELGLFHKNQGNKFNLADDLIEPYRPLVDLFTNTNKELVNKKLPKQQLIKLLYCEVETPRGKMSVSLSIEVLIESFVRVLKGEAKILELPKLKSLEPHLYEDNLQ